MRRVESTMKSLERRLLLAVDFEVDDDVLKVDGDSSANRIVVTIDEDTTSIEVSGSILARVDSDDFTAIVINGNGGSDSIRVLAQDRTDLFGFDARFLRIKGGSGNDLIRIESETTSSRCILSGGDGDDTIRAGGTHNELYGGDGSDSLYIERGRATLAGGDGNDKLSAQGASDVSTPRSLRGNSGRDTLIGSSFDDHLSGDGGRDRLYGNGGDDSIEGGAGIDTIFGGFGNDTIFGQQFGDSMFGGDGSDFFSLEERSGGEIHDFLYGNDFAY